ncbi:hypothetical protein [Burkholderia stagnalis]|uniref:hypothetical protein n=1 Tax=Burkholderia stagnalis TaxID=1503054 RepID=UPI000F595A6D|nr:hypothetical protein [Burkholderia stagnalis]
MEERHALANSNRSSWLASFDDHGRYVDPVTGFWESRSGEMYLPESATWVPAYDGEDDGDGDGDGEGEGDLQITIVSADSALAPDLPSHLFPGIGSAGAQFRVTSGSVPTRQAMNEYLEHAIVDSNLTNYDEGTGEGSFVVVDGDAPKAGTIVTLSGNQQSHLIVPIDVDDASTLTTAHPPMTIERYYDELDRHDWYSGFSDDYSVEKRGEAEYKRLVEIADQHGPDYQALCGAFRKHHFSGEAWSTPKYDKPARPVNGVLTLPSVPAAKAATEPIATPKSLTLADELPRNADPDQVALERARRISHAPSELPVDARTDEHPQPSEDLLRFRDVVIEERLIQFVSGNFFDICPLDRTAEAIDACLGRPYRPFGEKTPVRTTIEPALRALHCAYFDKMSASVRAGLPDTLLAYFGLNDVSGEKMLGRDAWGRVERAYKALAAPAAEQPTDSWKSHWPEYSPDGAVHRASFVQRVLTRFFAGAKQ